MATELALGVGVLLLPVVFVVLDDAVVVGTPDHRAGDRPGSRQGVARDGWCDTGLAHSLAEMMATNLALAGRTCESISSAKRVTRWRPGASWP